VSPFLASIKIEKTSCLYYRHIERYFGGTLASTRKEKFTHCFFLDMTLRSLISILSLSFASFSAFSFQLPASMLSMNSELATSPAKSALVHQETARCAHVFLINTRSGKDSLSVGRHHASRGGLLGADAAPVQRCGAPDLPRTTGEQIHRGVQVAQYRLKAGDLVFFQTGPNRRHVGVYIGDSQFIHASSSQGVTVSTLTDNYWQEHFITARRVAGSSV
jgi:lipoprotein Spr